jgi:hypothetical protein
MSIYIKKINSEKVEVLKPVDEKEDPRPVRGKNLFANPYGNLFFCARKNSGKTQTIATIIKKCCTIETQVIAFVSTLNVDPTWRAIRKMCEAANIAFHGHTSIKSEDGKADILDAIVEELQLEADAPPEQKSKGQFGSVVFSTPMQPKEKKPKKPKEKAPKYMFIFDDLSGELQYPSVVKLLKKNRHFKSRTIISSQYWNDVPKQARSQIDYVLLFGGLAQSPDKLEEIFKNIDIGIDFDMFVALYKFTTKKLYNFFYIDVRNDEFRQNFNLKLELKPPTPGEREV